MPKSYNRIWIHSIWSTKNRLPLLDYRNERIVYNYMKSQFIEMGCRVVIINGMPDHVHCLFQLSSQYSIAEVIKQIKGSSSHFINQNNLCKMKFAWQTGYASYSVSESIKESVFQYIFNQKKHHKRKTFQNEFDEIIRVFGFEKNDLGTLNEVD